MDHIRLKEKIALDREYREKVENISGVRKTRASQVVYGAVSDETLHQSIPSGTNHGVSLVQIESASHGEDEDERLDCKIEKHK